LPDNKNNVSTQQSIDKEKKTTQEAKIPKTNGNNTFLFFFRDNPLPKKTHEKKALSQKTNGQ
jgi:hypothetical protein